MKPVKPDRWILTIAAILPILAAAILLTTAFWQYTQDDVFITYVYSRNIATGVGFVFNPGQHVQGTTTPLYTLLMAGVYLLNHDLLHAGNLLSLVFLLGACGGIIALTRRTLSIYAQIAICLILVTSPLVYVSFGMETLFYTALLMLAFLLWAKDHRGWAMLVAALLTWTRADGLVLGGTIGLLALWDAWQDRPAGKPLPRLRDLPWKLAAIYLLGILPWFAFAWLYFGTPLPNTFSAKEGIFSGLHFLTDGFGWWKSFYGNDPVSLLAVPLGLVGLWQAAKNPRLRPVAFWSIFYTLGYTLLDVTAFWYYTPLFATVTLLAGIGGDWLARKLAKLTPRRAWVMAGAGIVVLGVTGLAVAKALTYAPPPPRVATYVEVGQWINQNTPPDSVLMLGDLGIVGYYAQRETLDVPGLIVPDMYEKTEGYAVAKYRPDYVVATQYWSWVNLTQQDWFHDYYDPVVQISTAGDPFSPMTVYKRRLPLETPSEVARGFDLPLTCRATLGAGDPVPTETHARLLDDLGNVVAEATQPFLAGQYPSDRALGDETLIDQMALPVDVPPGDYQWEITCGEVSDTGAVEIAPPVGDRTVLPDVQAATWPGFVQLSMVTFPAGSSTTWSGGTLTILFDWGVIGPSEEDLSVFVQLLDANGALVAQDDGYPRNGSVLTSSWTADQRVFDIRRLAIPPDLPAGDYTLIVGWYDWRTGERLLTQSGADSLAITTVHVRWPGGSGLP